MVLASFTFLYLGEASEICELSRKSQELYMEVFSLLLTRLIVLLLIMLTSCAARLTYPGVRTPELV